MQRSDPLRSRIGQAMIGGYLYREYPNKTDRLKQEEDYPTCSICGQRANLGTKHPSQAGVYPKILLIKRKMSSQSSGVPGRCPR